MAYLPGKPIEQAAAKPESIVMRSSFLQAATYDPANFALTVDLKGGHSIVYRYFFPVSWSQFKESPNHGSHYSRMVKGKFPSITLRQPMKKSDITKAKRPHKVKQEA